MTSGIIGIDTAGVVVSLNEGARRILACPQGALADAVGRPCRDVLAGQPAVARLLIETLERESPLSRAELELEGVSDSLRHPLVFSLTPVHEPAGSSSASCGGVHEAWGAIHDRLKPRRFVS